MYLEFAPTAAPPGGEINFHVTPVWLSVIPEEQNPLRVDALATERALRGLSRGRSGLAPAQNAVPAEQVAAVRGGGVLARRHAEDTVRSLLFSLLLPVFFRRVLVT